MSFKQQFPFGPAAETHKLPAHCPVCGGFHGELTCDDLLEDDEDSEETEL